MRQKQNIVKAVFASFSDGIDFTDVQSSLQQRHLKPDQNHSIGLTSSGLKF